MNFDAVRAVADAVLLEGYVLYPYRASAVKNRYRFAFGVVAPKAWGQERSSMRVDCLVAGPPERLLLRGLLRFLHIEERRVERYLSSGEMEEVDALEVGGELHLPWEEGRLREVPFMGEGVQRFELPGGYEIRWLRENEELRGRLVRTWSAVEGEIRCGVERLGPELARVRIELENVCTAVPSTRSEAIGRSLVSAHVLLGVHGGTFLSLLDPPDFAREAARACESDGLFPVLAGEPGCGDLVLAAPIILYDHPTIAPESPGDFFDATEIDELLALRTATLTEEEKREARATDPRAARLIDRVERLSPEGMGRLHGAFRSRRDARAMAALPRPGDRVRIRAGRRRTDAQDLLLEGMTARVEKVMQDVGGDHFLALTIEGDPAAALNREFGRFHYFRLDEVEVLS